MSDKRELLIKTALALFYRHGIHAVGINEVLQQAGVAKKTLYSHFAGKDELVVATVAYRDAIFYQWLEVRLAKGRSAKGIVDALFDALDDWFHDRVEALQAFRGCFFIKAAAEYSDTDHPIYRQCRQHKQRVMALLAASLRPYSGNKKAAGIVAEQLALLKEGAIILAHVQGDKAAARKAKRAARMLLEREAV